MPLRLKRRMRGEYDEAGAGLKPAPTTGLAPRGVPVYRGLTQRERGHRMPGRFDLRTIQPQITRLAE